VRTITLLLFTGIFLLLAGCGSVSNNMRPTPTPTPMPTPMPSPAPSPSPTPAMPDAFLASWLNNVGRNLGPLGTITLDTTANNGVGSTQSNGQPGGGTATFVLQFCPYPQGACTTITALNNNSNSTNFTFPMKGTFSGDFQIIDTTGFPVEVTGIGFSSGIQSNFALLPAATITGGIGQTTGNSPGTGRALVTGTTAHVTLTGAFPNHTFSNAVCALSTPADCINLANITTDAQGNASADVGTVQIGAFNIFRVSDASGVQFVTAFRVQ
jgi:hypothetical protein